MDGFEVSVSAGAGAEVVDGVTRLSIPAGEAGGYRLAQLDDYRGLARRAFPHAGGVRLTLSARVSTPALAGTWGFGLWNDPFSLSLGLGGGTRRFPALPQAAWFFFAGAGNHLSFRDDHPAKGMLAGVFRSARLPGWALSPAALGLPLLTLPPVGRLARRAARLLIDEDAGQLAHDVTGWHAYELVWAADGVRFAVDGGEVFETGLSPRGPLGFVLWIDNQYAAFPPDGRLAFGAHAGPAAWLDVRDLTLEPH